jgi:REP element-mobilizing transposase RayT
MSRLRRLALSHRVFFITTHFSSLALPITPNERDVVLKATPETRFHRGCFVHAYVVMPTHFHLLFSPAQHDTLTAILREIKLRSAKQILSSRGNQGHIWQARSFDRIIRDRREFIHTTSYIHLYPAADGIVNSPAEWVWSSWFGWNPGGNPPIYVDPLDRPLEDATPFRAAL